MTQKEENYIAQIKELFESKEEENIVLGLEILEGLRFFEPLFTHLFVIALYAQEDNTRIKAKKILKGNLPKDTYQFVRVRLSFPDTRTENFIEETYHQLKNFEELDAKLFALLSLHFTKQGGKFCLENKIATTQIILEAMCQENSLSLENFNLLYLPKEIGALTHLTSLNLSYNRLVDIPDSLGNLKKVEVLDWYDASITHRAEQKLEKYFPKIFAQDYYYQANTLVYQEKNKEALVLLEKASQLDPSSDRIWFELAFVLDNLKRHEEAIEAYDKSLELKEKKQNLNMTSYILNLANKALSLQYLGKHREKEETAQKVLEVVKTQNRNILQGNANFAFSKGLAYYLLEKYEEAQKAYDNAISIDPYYAVAWYNKACTYAMQKQKKEMLSCLKKAGELNANFLKTASEDLDFKFYVEDKDFCKLIKSSL